LRRQPVYSSQLDALLINNNFTNPLVNKAALVHSPALDVATFHKQLVEATVADTFLLEKAFDALVIDTLRVAGEHILQIAYHLYDYKNEAYCYFTSGEKNTEACFYIPSSHDNSGYNTFNRLNPVENPMLTAEKVGDFYILEKPGDGALAIHNGYNKFDVGKLLPYLISFGRSYSVKYLLDAMAVSKYLKTKYGKLHIWGFSQGGHAAMLISQFVKPATAVIASGYSVLFDRFYGQGADQITATGVLRYLQPDSLRTRFNDSGTKLLLTYGAREEGLYSMEYQHQYTQKTYQASPSFVFRYHENAHEWPVGTVNEFYQTTE
jgi:hypothetical protein